MTDAIDLAQQTLAALGPDAAVTRLLESAQIGLGERAKKKARDQQFETAKTLLEAGRYGDATQLLNQGMAAQILPPTDPRTQELLAQIQQRSTSSGPAQRPLKEPPPAEAVIERAARSIGKFLRRERRRVQMSPNLGPW